MATKATTKSTKVAESPEAQLAIATAEAPMTPEAPAPAETEAPALTEAPAPAETETPADNEPAPIGSLVVPAPPAAPLAIAGELAAPVMPSLDDEPLAAPKPQIAYKIPFGYSTKDGFAMSINNEDSEASGTNTIGGKPHDLRLVISKANWEGHPEGALDYRLGFEFVNEQGILCELNISAARPSRDNPDYYVMSGPCRSLLGGLLAITGNDEDSAGFGCGVRINITKGRGRSLFLDTAVVCMIRDQLTWVTTSGPAATTTVPQGVSSLIATVREIKAAFVAQGLLQDTQTIYGEQLLTGGAAAQGDFTAIPVMATVVDESQT